MKAAKPLILFCIGGAVYIAVEITWRYLTGSSHTHWVMFIVGGMSFISIGCINEYMSWDTLFQTQVAIGTFLVLILEFTSGCILNIWLKLNIWDYSNMPFNVLGQICLPFAIAWIILVSIAIVLDDWLRYVLFGEEKPRYRFK